MENNCLITRNRNSSYFHCFEKRFSVPYSNENWVYMYRTSQLYVFLVPRRRREKDLYNDLRLWFRSSVRLLPRYLQIALVNFYDFFRKDVTFANSERNVFGFLKKSFVFQILGKKTFSVGKNK